MSTIWRDMALLNRMSTQRIGRQWRHLPSEFVNLKEQTSLSPRSDFFLREKLDVWRECVWKQAKGCVTRLKRESWQLCSMASKKSFASFYANCAFRVWGNKSDRLFRYVHCNLWRGKYLYIPPMIAFAKFITSGFLMDRLVAFSKQRTILLQPLPTTNNFTNSTAPPLRTMFVTKRVQ